MKQRLLLLLFLLCVVGDIKAQSIEPLLDTKKNAFRLTPLSYFTGEINASYEKRLGKEYGIQLGLGSIWYDWLVAELGEEILFTPWPAKGFTVRIDMKGYLRNLLHNIPLANYVAVQFLYKHIELKNALREFDNSADRANIKKDVGGLKLLLGRQMDGPGALIMNLYSGIGIRYREQRENIYWQRNYDPLTDITTISIDVKNENHTWIYPTFHLGIDVGFEF